MILVDTSVWIDHFKNNNSTLSQLLEESRVATHIFVIGELACGNLKNRTEILSLLHALPESSIPANQEILSFIDHHHLSGCGLGYIDIYLLAVAKLDNYKLWTLDKTLLKFASKLHLAYEE